MKFDWNYFKNRLVNSPNDVQVFEKTKIPIGSTKDDTALEAISNNVSCILVNKYLRILGTSDSMYENIFSFTDEFRDIFGEDKYIVAYDVFGGLFASEKTIHYFSPDNLRWEDLGVNYEGFINWIINEDITEFYEPFLGNGMDDLISKVRTDEGIFIYPFLWTKECDMSTVFKKIVPFRDLLVVNAENKPLLAEVD
jgi:hypothetical protein